MKTFQYGILAFGLCCTSLFAGLTFAQSSQLIGGTAAECVAQQPACPDTRILDCAGNTIGARECITPVETTQTDVTTTATDCPVYETPKCRSDQKVVTSEVPVQFRVTGCPTTMQLCEANEEEDVKARTPSNQCGENQTFNSSIGRCENTDNACQPFLRYCVRGENPDQICSCSPTVASVEGSLACVPLVKCPDNRVLNCDATYMANTRNCKAVTEPEIEVVETETDSSLLKQLEQCLLDYRTEITRVEQSMSQYAFKNRNSDTYNHTLLMSQPWYANWYNRCKNIIPSLGISHDSEGSVYQAPESAGGSGVGGGEGTGGGHGGW